MLVIIRDPSLTWEWVLLCAAFPLLNIKRIVSVFLIGCAWQVVSVQREFWFCQTRHTQMQCKVLPVRGSSGWCKQTWVLCPDSLTLCCLLITPNWVQQHQITSVLLDSCIICRIWTEIKKSTWHRVLMHHWGAVALRECLALPEKHNANLISFSRSNLGDNECNSDVCTTHFLNSPDISGLLCAYLSVCDLDHEVWFPTWTEAGRSRKHCSVLQQCAAHRFILQISTCHKTPDIFQDLLYQHTMWFSCDLKLEETVALLSPFTPLTAHVVKQLQNTLHNPGKTLTFLHAKTQTVWTMDKRLPVDASKDLPYDALRHSDYISCCLVTEVTHSCCLVTEVTHTCCLVA